MTREAACHCGQLTLQVKGEPLRVSICHCLACQRRTGSAFGMQAGFRSEQVTVAGDHKDFSRVSDEADLQEHVFHFCPECGSQVFYTDPGKGFVVVSVGAFADPGFPAPTEAGYDHRRHRWLQMPEGLTGPPGRTVWAEAHPLYESGRYAEAAALGRELADAHPEYPDVAYNTACCASLAGDRETAFEFLRRAIAGWPGFREQAERDTDFDPIRDDPEFEAVIDG
jgi:hypothetical protein